MTPDADGLELLRELIRNACVNEGTPESGFEIRSVRTLEHFFAGTGLDYEVVEPLPGRASLVGRIRGTDPDAPSLALLGHLDVVPAEPAAWQRDPFGAEIVDGTLWGRGTIDMLGLTAAMAVVVKRILVAGVRPAGDLVFAATADEEAGGAHGVGWIVENRPELLDVDYALTENGGVQLGPDETPGILLTVGEKGIAALTLTLSGRPGHGSVPFGSDGAAGVAADVIRRLLDAPGEPVVQEHWAAFARALALPDDLTHRLTDPATLDEALPELGALAGYAHALTHLTAAPNIVSVGSKLNVIPGSGSVRVDSRLLPGQTADDAVRHVTDVLGPLAARVAIEVDEEVPAGLSPWHSPLVDVVAEVFGEFQPGSHLVPLVASGGTDGRYLRERGTHVYGIGLYSREVELGDYRRRFHGNDERVDLASLALTERSLAAVVERFLKLG